MMLHTRLCKLLNIGVLVLGAPMGPDIAGLDLAAAVSNAGGLGMISWGGYPPPALGERIRRLRTMTSKPFGVNVLLEGPHLPVPESAFVDACIAERVPVLSFFWGDPTPYVEKAHKAGVKACDQVGSVGAAKRAATAGVDFIIAQGVEAGGHIAGTVSTMVLTLRVVETVAPIPVVTAGGIADGRGLAAALALGAEGVVLGTRLIASTESNAHPIYKEKVLAATEEDTVRTTLFGNGWPNAYHRTWVCSKKSSGASLQKDCENYMRRVNSASMEHSRRFRIRRRSPRGCVRCSAPHGWFTQNARLAARNTRFVISASTPIVWRFPTIDWSPWPMAWSPFGGAIPLTRTRSV
jgi:NAD(P)H-dependent flavin oxidoreductase YrpB (nitropropane dioxygenase family)